MVRFFMIIALNRLLCYVGWAMLIPLAGDVVFARFFFTPVIILNSLDAAQETLVKRSAKYSSRRYSYLQIDL